MQVSPHQRANSRHHNKVSDGYADDFANLDDSANAHLVGGEQLAFSNAIRYFHVDWLAGLLLSAALLTEGTLLAIDKSFVLAACFKLLCVYNLTVAFGFYFFRVYTNRPRAGKTLYLWNMLVIVVLFIVLSVWASVDVIIRAAKE